MLSQFRLQHLAARVHIALELMTPHPHQRLRGPLPLASLAARVNRPLRPAGHLPQCQAQGASPGLRCFRIRRLSFRVPREYRPNNWLGVATGEKSESICRSAGYLGATSWKCLFAVALFSTAAVVLSQETRVQPVEIISLNFNAHMFNSKHSHLVTDET